jgi:hypothetical protein
MLGKMILLIVALGAVASALLAVRQSRLQAASEIVQSQLRINAMDERLAALRVAVAQRVSPESVRAMAAELGEADAALVPLAQAAGDWARDEAQRARDAEAAAQDPEAESPQPPRAEPGSRNNPDGTPRLDEPKPKPNRAAPNRASPNRPTPKRPDPSGTSRRGAP